MAGPSPDQDARRLACQELRADLRAKFKKHIVRKDERFPEASWSEDKQYIRWHDVASLWLPPETIRNVLFPSNPTLSEEILIREKLLKVLSILVYIKAHECLDSFKAHYISESGRTRLSDAELPLQDASADRLLGLTAALKEKFLQRQYLFVPVSQRSALEIAIH